MAAGVYIVLIAGVMNWGTKMVRHPNSFLAPVAVISLFTLSAAIMGYLFCYQPIQLCFENKKKQAINLFLKTTLIFGIITIAALTPLFSGAF